MRLRLEKTIGLDFVGELAQNFVTGISKSGWWLQIKRINRWYLYLVVKRLHFNNCLNACATF